MIQASKTRLTVADHFDLAIQGEYAAQELYQGLMHLFRAHPDAVELWREFAVEETEHALTLQGILDALTPEQQSPPANTGMVLAAQQALSVPVAQHLAGVKTLEDACELVSDLENSETNAVFEFLLSHFDADNQISPFVLTQLREHIARLQTFDERLGGRYQRLKIKAEP